MKVLIVTQYFYPENFKSNDMAFELKKRGYDVTVLTGIPNYPEGKFYSNYSIFKNRKQTINGVKVYRALLFPRWNGKGIKLPLNYFSWAFFASIKAFFLGLTCKFDVIIVHEPSPITQGFPAIIIKKMQKIPLYFWVLDLWPESLTSAGGIKNKYVLNFFTRIVKFIYKNSDKILISSKGFRDSICEKGNFENKLIYFPNWAEDIISKGDLNYTIPRLPEGFKIIFAGNIGTSQDMESLMKTALLLKENSNIKFLIIGDGRERKYVEEYIVKNELEKTVFVLGKFPIETMSAFFDKADALLVTLKDELIFNITVPAKIQAYLSAKKPILAMINGEGASLINNVNCGIAVPAAAATKLKEAILNLYHLPSQERVQMGNNGFEFFNQNFTLEKCMNNLELIISENKNE